MVLIYMFLGLVIPIIILIYWYTQYMKNKIKEIYNQAQKIKATYQELEVIRDEIIKQLSIIDKDKLTDKQSKVVSNTENRLSEIRQRLDNLGYSYNKHMAHYKEYLDLLGKFGIDV